MLRAPAIRNNRTSNCDWPGSQGRFAAQQKVASAGRELLETNRIRQEERSRSLPRPRRAS